MTPSQARYQAAPYPVKSEFYLTAFGGGRQVEPRYFLPFRLRAHEAERVPSV